MSVGGALIITALFAPALLKRCIGGGCGWRSASWSEHAPHSTRRVLRGNRMPIAGLLRIFGRDPLGLKLSAEETSYKVVRAKRPASHMLRQY